MNHKSHLENGIYSIRQHTKNLSQTHKKLHKFLPQSTHKFCIIFSILSLIFSHKYLIHLCIKYVRNCCIFYKLTILSQYHTHSPRNQANRLTTFYYLSIFFLRIVVNSTGYRKLKYSFHTLHIWLRNVS